jgi:hypothetical protein
MSISSLIGTRLLSGIAAFALTGSLVGATAMAAQPDSPVRELRHDVRDQSKAQREDIKQLRAEFAAEYVKERPDTDKLERLQAEIDAKRSEISAMKFAALMQMHDALDAEQREKLAERMAKQGKGKHHGKKGDKGDKAKAERGDKAERETAAKDKKGKKGKGKGKGDKANKGDKAKSERAPV